MRHFSLFVAVALVGVGPAASATAQSSGADAVCISPSAVSDLEQCPANASQVARAPRSNAPVSRLVAAERRQEETKNTGPTGPSIELDEAARRNRQRVQGRAFDLLRREIRVLNRLIQNTSASDPRRPDILLRKAETLFEMQTVVNARVRSFDEPIFEARQAENAAKMRDLRQQQQQTEQRLTSVREEAIRTYATLVQDHPNYGRMDEVLFSLAYGLDELRQHDRARQVYSRLIKGYPASRFVPHAYLSFAEFFFNEADMGAALQFYNKVVEFPPERNPVYGYSLYKSAWAYYNVEDFENSLQKFVEVIEFAMANPESADSENLARQSRREMVLPYAMVGSPNRALEFFRRYTTSEEQAIETFETLGELYYDTGQWPNTIAVYQKLLAEQPREDKVCYWQTRITNAIISSRPKEDQVREIRRMVDLYETFEGQGGHSQESLATCQQEAATILVSLATAWHRETIGTADQPGTNDTGVMRLAAALYEIVLDKFPNLEQMEFPMIDRRDWPTQYKVSYYFAELLWKMEDWTRCGPAFDRVVELNPTGDYTADAAYAAVLCYNNLYQQEYQGRERQVAEREQQGRRGRRGRRQQEAAEPSYEPREFTDLESGMLGAFQRYVCYIPDSDDLPTIKYRRARIYYEANRFEEAALLFKDIAFNHEDSDLSVYAANLYLDSLNVLGSQVDPPRVSCITEIKESIEPLSGSYCASDDDYDQNSELCQVLDRLRCDVLRKEAEAFQANDQFQRAARAYVDIFRNHQECAAVAEEQGQPDYMAEVLYNAAINFEAARLLGRAIQVRKVLVERFNESEYSQLATYQIGANYHALAIYGQAAEWYERFAREFPGQDGDNCREELGQSCRDAVAHEALQNAVFFRLGLGEEEAAVDDARLFERNYRRTLPRQTSQVVFSLGSIYERQENWTKVIDHYRGFLRSYRRQALPQQVIRAHVEIGTGYWNSNDKGRAESFFRDAVRAYQGGAAEAIAGISDAEEAERALWTAQAKDAASEALFFLAEYKFEEFREVDFPTYRGGRTLERVQEWAQGDFLEWVEEKAQKLVAAKTEYEKIAELEVPTWEIAAAARIGEMYRSFVDEFRDAPIPQEIENDPELFDIYVGALDERSQPFVEQAKDAFEFCLIRATQVRWFNEFSRQCEQELNRLDPAQYPLAAELRGEPNFANSTAGRPRPVFELQTAEEAAAEADTSVEGGDQS